MKFYWFWKKEKNIIYSTVQGKKLACILQKENKRGDGTSLFFSCFRFGGCLYNKMNNAIG